MEGTKYPLGWSLLVGGPARLGLDVTWVAIVLDLVLVAVLVAVVWAVTRRWGAIASGTAAVATAVGASLWSSVYVVMPDLALTAVVAVALWWMTTLEEERRGHLAWATGLAAAAVLLKTVGIVLAGALTVALFLRPRLRRWSWVPVTVGLVLTGLQMLAVAGYPEHTTGYAATFWLRNPYDAAAGRIGPGGLPARIVERMDQFWTDAGYAVLGAHVPSPVAIAATLALLVVAVLAYRRWRVPVTAFVVVYAVLLAAWPYRSARFGLPLLPLAAAGLAALIGVVQRRTNAAVAGVLAVALLVPHAVGNVTQARADARAEADDLAALHAASDDLAAWIDAHVPADDALASLDYREVAYRTGREVLPLAYTTDTEALLAASAGRGARWLVVVRGLYGRREARADALLSAYPDRFELVHHNARTDVYRILPGGNAP